MHRFYACYVDHNISAVIVAVLRGAGHDVVTVRELGLTAATDDEHLHRAALDGRVLLTNNVDDCELLHDAWRRWPVALNHAGILILFQEAAPHRMAQEVIAFLATGPPLVNTLYKWRPSAGWARRP